MVGGQLTFVLLKKALEEEVVFQQTSPTAPPKLTELPLIEKV